MLRFFLLFIFLTIHTINSYGQNNSFQFIKSVKIQADFFTTDHLGNSYVIAGNTLTKFDKSGLPTHNFSKRKQGDFRFVDARDPLKILLYYPDFGLIDFLDNKLSENAFLDLNQYNIYQATALCRSINNGIWLYDAQKMQLILINSELGIVTESNLLHDLFSDQYVPGIMAESEEWLVICDKKKGFRVFDRLAAFYKQIVVTDITNFQVNESDLFFLQNEKLISINIRTGVKSVVETPDLKNAIDARIERDRIFILFKDHFDIYRMYQ